MKLLFHRHKVSAWDDEKVLKMRQGLHNMKMINDTKWYTKTSQNGRFYVIHILL